MADVFRTWMTGLALLFCILAVQASWAKEVAKPVGGQGTLEVFVRDGCPHCAEAKRFLGGLGTEYPQLEIVYRPVDRDAVARDELIRRSREAGVWPPGVPTFSYDGRLLVGFDGGVTGGGLRALIADQGPVDGRVETGWLGTLSVPSLGLPLFTLALGLLDGFNPCAMWVLLFLLSILVHLHDRRRMALVAGTFVLVSGAVYFAFMAAWLNLFLAVGMTTGLRLTLASVALVIGAVNLKDFLTRFRGPSLSIPASAKPGLYARLRGVMQAHSLLSSLLAIAALAVVVNFVELLCTAGLPALYTAVLAQQHLSPAAHYGYLGLYILGYIADDSLMVASAVLALGSRKLSERGGRRLKLLSGSLMLALGGILLLRPQWLL